MNRTTRTKDLSVSPTKGIQTEPTAGLLGMDIKGDDEESIGDLWGDEDQPVGEEDEKEPQAGTSPSVQKHKTTDGRPVDAAPREAEEAHGAKIRPSPTLPSPKEVAEHDATHCPYRSWCPVCVSASGHEAPHCKRSERDGET